MTNLAEELRKLNELRVSGVLSEEEFAEQKSRLMAKDKVVSGKADMDGYPTQKIANAVAMLRATGLEEREIATKGHRWLWQRGFALPPGPYVAREKGPYALLCAGMALFAGTIAYMVFSIMTGGGISFWTGLGLYLVFFAVFFLILPGNLQATVRKKKLPEWDQIPG
ncbi:DUF6404 family protein [Paraurantiacibacter namhicola]|uniref:SHOCT domain-containing protein n=1 Tax=Paraurantiacibacter namhicola TaxID=645517 RepID=A0A1C7D730_9SPHN|nr:DUF6404 family protein [Paraurantiacibacter namhicola]ANU07258.1 hypothetical protein A6F65_00948 [Paraurantiacibacter namhicola]